MTPARTRNMCFLLLGPRLRVVLLSLSTSVARDAKVRLGEKNWTQSYFRVTSDGLSERGSTRSLPAHQRKL